MQLIMNPGLLDEQVFEFPEGSVTIGRTEESTICVLHKSLSRRHARLDREGARIVLVDLSSKNGTFVNEQRCAAPTPVGETDVIRVGSVGMRLRAIRAFGATVTA